MVKRNVLYRKSNAILEYGIIIFVVVGALTGMHMYLQRHIQARIKDEARRTGFVLYQPGPGIGLEWGSSLTIYSSSSTSERTEEIGGKTNIDIDTSSSQTTLQAPVPSIKGFSVMEHKGSAISVQDAPSAAPLPDYPDLEYKEWDDQGWEMH
ncbi:MAG: hypothetical protein PHE97_04145 [Candidatus Omnitrophica bacterium]|nr:hypothetical protein [Candidatus Omnitrophota bacterium]